MSSDGTGMGDFESSSNTTYTDSSAANNAGATPSVPVRIYPDMSMADGFKENLTSFLYSGPFAGNTTNDIWNRNIWASSTNFTDPCVFFSEWSNVSQFFNCSKDDAALELGNFTNATTTSPFHDQPKYELWLTLLFSLLAGIVSIVTILGNLLVLVAFFVDRSIRQPSNYFIASLAVSDFILGLASMPLYTMYELLGYWPVQMGPWICDLWLSLDYTVCLTSQYTVFFITLDRFCSVRIPAKYRNWRSEKKVLVMVAVTWIVPILVFFITIIGWQFFDGGRTVGPTECYVQFMASPIFNCVLVIGYYWVTLFVMIGLYASIYHVAWNLQRKSNLKHKKMTSIVTMGNAMTKIGMGMANSAKDTKNNADKQTKKAIKATKKYSTTSFNSSKDKEEGSSAAYASDSESNTPKPSPKNQNRGKSQLPSDKVEHAEMNSTLLKPSMHAAKSNGIETPPPCYDAVINNNINGDVYKEIDHIGHDLEDGATATITSPSSPKCQSSNPHDSPESPIWKKRVDFSSEAADICEAEEILPSRDRQDAVPGGANPVDIISEHANGKTVTKVVPNGRKIRLNINAVVQRITNAKFLKKSTTEKIKKSKSENRARKALRTITLILGAFVLFWTPYHIVVLIVGFCPPEREKCVSDLIYSVTYWLCYCNSPLNPFCYAAANQNFKKTFTRILKGDFRRR